MGLNAWIQSLELPPLSMAVPVAVSPNGEAPRRHSREALLAVLERVQYGGELPGDLPLQIVPLEADRRSFAGKAIVRRRSLRITAGPGTHTFGVTLVIPGKANGHAVVLLNFRPDVPDLYWPAEELADREVVVAAVWYQEVAADSVDRESGLDGLAAPFFPAENRPGKLALWAWAASRVLDLLLAEELADPRQIAVAGHSRLGKTALLAAARDQRFAVAFSNDSGQSGAALNRGKRAGNEQIAEITRTFPYWFVPGFADYAGRERDLPFDQHWLLAAIAPRKVYVASAADDLWAAPDSEFLCCVAASEAWQTYGLKGLISPDRLPQTGDRFAEGSIGYHRRAGDHFLSREDWQGFLDFWLSGL